MHIRHGRINWRLVAWMAPPSVVGAVAGGVLAGAIPEGLLLGVIAAVLIQSAIELLRGPAEARVRRTRRAEQRRAAAVRAARDRRCSAGWSA